MLPNVRIEPATIRIPDGRAAGRATAPGGSQEREKNGKNRIDDNKNKTLKENR